MKQDYEELKKTVAEWAGFRLEDFNDRDLVGSGPVGNVWSDHWIKAWRYPDGMFHEGDGGWDSLPDFPNDLTPCVKWLTPKLSFWEVITCVRLYTRAYVWAGENNEKFGSYKSDSELNPALALCLAIEKMMGKEWKNDHSINRTSQ